VLALAHLGRREEVAAHLDEFVVGRPGFGAAADETPTYMDVFRLEAAALVGHRPAAAKLVERLAASGHVTTGVRLPTCIARHLGAACALLGRPDDALAHYRAALDLATAIGPACRRRADRPPCARSGSGRTGSAGHSRGSAPVCR